VIFGGLVEEEEGSLIVNCSVKNRTRRETR